MTLTEASTNFLCCDTSGGENPHPTGKVKTWLGEALLWREQRQNANGDNILELKTHKDYEICYTTDGLNAKESGEIVLPADCRYVRVAVYYKKQLVIEDNVSVAAIPPPIKIDDAKPLEYTMNTQKKCGDTDCGLPCQNTNGARSKPL